MTTLVPEVVISNIETIEDLPLARRIELAEKYIPLQNLKKDCLIDIKNNEDQWYVAIIRDISETEIRVTFDEMSEEHNKNFKQESDKIAEFRQMTKCHTEFNNTSHLSAFTLELLNEHKRKLEQIIRTTFACWSNPLEITQYLRGHLYIFVDVLLNTEHKEAELPELYSFLKLVIEMIALWLKRLAGDLFKSFIEYKQYPKLVFVDKNCALAACEAELLDMLRWLFALAPRNVAFFAVNSDVGTAKYTKVIVSTESSEKLDPKDNISSSEKAVAEKPVVYGLVVNLFESFCSHGGLDAILEFASLEKIIAKAKSVDCSDSSIPFQTIATILYPLKVAKLIAIDEVHNKIASGIKKGLIIWVEQLNEREIEKLDTKEMNGYLKLIEDLLSMSCSKYEATTTVQDQELKIAQIALQCKSLSSQLYAVNTISQIIESRRNEPEFIDGVLIEYLTKHDVLKRVLVSTQVEVIRNSSTIFEFLAVHDKLNERLIELVDEYQQEKDEFAMLPIQKISSPIMKFLTLEQIQLINEKIRNFPLNDLKSMLLMMEFTLCVLEGKGRSDLVSTEAIPELICDSNEVPVIHENIKSFWNVIQDESSFTIEESETAFECLVQILTAAFSEGFRAQYLELCIDNLKNHRSVPQSLKLIRQILSKSAPSDWIKEHWQSHNLFRLFIEDCEYYGELVKEFCVKKERQIKESTIAGRYSHQYNLENRLNFFKYMMQSGGKDLGIENKDIERLCNLYLNSCEYDTRYFLQCFSAKQNRKATCIFNREGTKHFFDIIVAARSKLITLNPEYYQCFALYFQLINIATSALSFKLNSFKVLDFGKLIGMNELWETVCCCKGESTLKHFSELLIGVYTKIECIEKVPETTKALVNRCFKIILHTTQDEPITNLVGVLNAMIDDINGKKYELEFEEEFDYTCILNLISKPSDEKQSVEVPNTVRIGSIRKLASIRFDIPFSETEMKSEQRVFPVSENDMQFDVTNYSHTLYIQRVKSTTGNAKTFLAGNKVHIDTLLALSAKENKRYVDSVNRLLETIVTDNIIRDDLESISPVEEVI